MIKYIFLFLLISAGIMVPVDSIASNIHAYTHTNTPIELKPISLNNSYKIAAVCFLGMGDCGEISFDKGDDDMEVDTGDQCKNAGFDKTCPTGWRPEIGIICPHDSGYVKCCKENCPANTSVDCTGAATGSDGCGYTCKKCCVSSCPSGYTYSSIPNGYVQDGEACMHCTQGIKYKVKANPCDGFSTCPYGPSSGAATCLSGTTTKYSSCRPCNASCPSGTSESNPGGCGGSTRNECNTKTCYYGYQSCCSDECPSYHSIGRASSCTYGGSDCYDSCGGNWWHNCNSAPPSNPCDSVTAVSCGSLGCKSYYSNCSSKCQTCNTSVANPCDSVTAVSVPSNAYCSSYHSSCSSKCSGWSCSSGYTQSGNSCVNGCVSGGSSSCSGQTSACSSTQTQTSSCKDCSGTTRYTCQNKSCEQQGYVTTCSGVEYVGAGASCDGKYKSCNCASGYQWISSSQICGKPTSTCGGGNGYYSNTSCSSFSGVSCSGNYGPSYLGCTPSQISVGSSCDPDAWRRCCESCNGT